MKRPIMLITPGGVNRLGPDISGFMKRSEFIPSSACANCYSSGRFPTEAVFYLAVIDSLYMWQ